MAEQADAARVARRHRAYRWSSSRRPRTKPSTAFSCYVGLSPLSAKPGGDTRHTANVWVSVHRHAGSRIADTRSHPASGRRPNTVGRLLRWQTSIGIRAKSWETAPEAFPYTTASGLLKQPDKQKLASAIASLPDAMLSWIRDRRRIIGLARGRRCASAWVCHDAEGHT